MIKFILKRLAIAVPTLLAVITLVFFLVHLSPGNPFDGDRALSPEAMATVLHQYRLDLPLWQQYLYYLNDLIHGNFGISMKYRGTSINSLLFPDNMGGFWVTGTLSVYTMLFAVPLGIILGSYAGFKRSGYFDKFFMGFSVIFSAIPTIVTGPILVLVFAVIFRLFPAGGFGDGGFEHLFLPVFVLVLSYSPTIILVTRGSILEILNTNYIRTARAKGLSNYKVLFKHALKPTLLPVISLLGPMFAGILVGAVVTEQVFSLPGIGLLTTNAATNRDYNMIMAITIFGSSLTILFNIVVDVFYFILDPRIKQ